MRRASRRRPLTLLALALALPALALLSGAPATAGAEDLGALLDEFEARLGRRDDEGYAAQQAVLDRIADLRSDRATKELRRLLRTHGASDRRVATGILAGIVRRGDGGDVDFAVAWAAERRDPLLEAIFDRVVAASQEPATRVHWREEALPRTPMPLKAAIVRGLARAGDVEATVPILMLLKEDDPHLRTEAMEALGALRETKATPSIALFLNHDDWRLRVASARALAVMKDPAARPTLERVVARDEVARVVESATRAIVALDDPASIPVLIERLEREGPRESRLVDALASALTALTGKSLGLNGESWRIWWDAVKDRPFAKAPPEGPGATVQGTRYHGFPVRSDRVVFVLDTSHSMAWNGRIDEAKAELIRTIGSLPPRTRFNVVTYNDGVATWEDALTEATPAEIRRAVKYVERLGPSGGTNTWSALETAMRDPEVDTVFFLSDGHPSVGPVVDPELILAQVRAENRWRRVRLHTIGLLRGEPPAAFAGLEDADRAATFMLRLAAENDGQSQILR